jgi:hypothetical protein
MTSFNSFIRENLQEWDYEDMPTQNQGKERRARRKAKRIANRKKKKEERLAAIKVRCTMNTS